MPHRLDYFPETELIGLYRKVFSSNEGKEVLAHILAELGMFDYVSDGSEDVALKNYGTKLLKILSGNEPAKESIQAFMMNLMKQPLPDKKKKEN